MKIDFSQQLKNLDGVVFQEKGAPVTLGQLAEAALLATYQDEAGRITGENKYQRFEVAAKIHGQAEVEVNEAEAGIMRALIGKMYGPDVVGPTYRALFAPAAATPAALGRQLEEAPAATGKRRRKLTAVPEPTQDSE